VIKKPFAGLLSPSRCLNRGNRSTWASGEDVPRNLAFLFSRNRLNVAISRAQCLAYLVCSPRLLEARCKSIDEMELVNALCRLAEYAQAKAI
jgi:uncharacterized protein